MKRKFLPISFILAQLVLLPSCSFLGESRAIGVSPTMAENQDGSLTWEDHLDRREFLGPLGRSGLTSTGDVNLLVIPIDFASSPFSFNDKFLSYENSLEAINDAFFGDESGYWESVSSYYKKSSYGKLNIRGAVADVITMPKSANYYSNLVLSGKSVTQVTTGIGEYAIDTLSKSGFDFSLYDNNSDKIIDGIWFVYSYSSSPLSDLWWAFTTVNTKSVKSTYKSGIYAWASIDFLTHASSRYVDSHTFIHETGHMLGLDDYYDYDEDMSSLQNYDAPLGGLDMMDFNIGDHNAFSKYLLGWIKPRQVVKPGKYVLNNFVESGDSIIIDNSFNGTPFDEYVILEAYTPNGLNALDSNNSYVYSFGEEVFMFKEFGLKALHVDSRLGYINNAKLSTASWDKQYIKDINYYVKNGKPAEIIASNTPSFSFTSTKTNKVLEFISKENNGDLRYKDNPKKVSASDSDLYGVGDSLTKYTFNDGSKLPFSIFIESIDAYGNITLNITE